MDIVEDEASLERFTVKFLGDGGVVFEVSPGCEPSSCPALSGTILGDGLVAGVSPIPPTGWMGSAGPGTYATISSGRVPINVHAWAGCFVDTSSEQTAIALICPGIHVNLIAPDGTTLATQSDCYASIDPGNPDARNPGSTRLGGSLACPFVYVGGPYQYMGDGSEVEIAYVATTLNSEDGSMCINLRRWNPSTAQWNTQPIACIHP